MMWPLSLTCGRKVIGRTGNFQVRTDFALCVHSHSFVLMHVLTPFSRETDPGR